MLVVGWKNGWEGLALFAKSKVRANECHEVFSERSLKCREADKSLRKFDAEVWRRVHGSLLLYTYCTSVTLVCFQLG